MTPDQLAQTHRAAFRDHGAWDADAFATLIDQPGVIVIGEVDAFALIRVTLDEAELLTIATLPERQGQGLARANLTAAERAARQAGAISMFLEVAEDNTAARALYECQGYGEVGRRKGYYRRHPHDAVAALVLRKSL